MTHTPPQNIDPELVNIINNKYGRLIIPDQNTENNLTRIINIISTRLSDHCDFAEKNLYTEKFKKIEFGFLNKTDLNAFAYSSPESFDFIGINIGVVFTVANVFNRILAHPENFPDIGNIKIEKNDIELLPYLTTDVISSELKMITPKCPIRSMFAHELACVAIDFLFFHELTHLRFGHVDYIRNLCKISEFAEAFNSHQKKDTIVRQALEYDADCGAIVLSVNRAYSHKDFLLKTNTSVPTYI